MARQSGVPERSPELGKYGQNLPAAVEYLGRTEPAAYAELVRHLRHVVPSMEQLKTDCLETKQLGLFFSESGVGRPWASQDISDGTIQAVALFLTLLDPRVKAVVIEEPENSIHPWILRHFSDLCKSTAERKQVFLTTHSTVLVDEVPTEALLIAVRRRGETSIFQAIEKFPEMKEATKSARDSGAIEGVPEPGLVGEDS